MKNKNKNKKYGIKDEQQKERSQVEDDVWEYRARRRGQNSRRAISGTLAVQERSNIGDKYKQTSRPVDSKKLMKTAEKRRL